MDDNETLLDFDKMAKSLLRTINTTIASLKTLNIIVIGKTGVGKSTLINTVFRDNMAETGIGKPVTKKLRKLKKSTSPLVIYDTPGLELDEASRVAAKEEVWKTINDCNATGDFNQMIHCIWYCINTESSRIEPEEIQWIRELTDENKIHSIPVIIVLTRSFNENDAAEMRNMLEKENMNVRQIIPVVAKDYEIPRYCTINSYGLDTLIKITGECLPDELKKTLQNVQIANLNEKVRHAKLAVYTATAAAATAAAVPIPFSNYFPILGTQFVMLSKITTLFGYSIRKDILLSFFTATFGLGGATFLSKLAVANLLELIPGVGSTTGAAINALAAGAITTALGNTYIGIMKLIFNKEMRIDDLASEKGKALIKKLFQEELAKSRQSN